MAVVSGADLQRRQRLKKLLVGLVFLALAAFAAMLVDYSFRQAQPPQYRFRLPPLAVDQPVILTQDNFMLVVARYSPVTLQDLAPKGRESGVPASFSGEQPVVDGQGYFVARAYGTHIGCPLEIEAGGFRESCSDARYDRLGRALEPTKYVDLEKIDYYFSRNKSLLYTE
jgi:hypothetical protein